MGTKKISTNLLAQIITVFLSILVISGLGIDAEATGLDIAKAFTEGSSFWGLLGIFGVNFINSAWHWFKAVQEGGWKQLTLFIHSINWWVSFGNMVVAILLAFFPDVIIDPGTMEGIVGAIFEADWTLLIKLIIVNLILPILKTVFKKKPLEVA